MFESYKWGFIFLDNKIVDGFQLCMIGGVAVDMGCGLKNTCTWATCQPCETMFFAWQSLETCLFDKLLQFLSALSEPSSRMLQAWSVQVAKPPDLSLPPFPAETFLSIFYSQDRYVFLQTRVVTVLWGLGQGPGKYCHREIGGTWERRELGPWKPEPWDPRKENSASEVSRCFGCSWITRISGRE